jgi:pimeloyl-ACP methyl ester carboxylesterase
VQITLASGKSHTINYNCTLVESSNSSLPTIWFEADLSHGVVDFLGLQTILALDHSRNSCSYDPPNFGWSDPLPADLVDYFDYFNPLLDAIGRENEEMVLVGWGGGAKYALMHAIENRNTTTSVVLLDASPDGIEWLDAQRKNNWTETQMLNYRSTDLSGRIFLAETILGLGIPWYVAITSLIFLMNIINKPIQGSNANLHPL